MDILSECERSFGLARGSWSPEHWKAAAQFCSDAYNRLEPTAEGIGHSLREAVEQLNQANETLSVACKENREQQEAIAKLEGWIEQLIPIAIESKSRKPAGRPRKPYNALLALLNHRPKQGVGRPKKYSENDQLVFVAIIDRIKKEQGLTTDSSAVACACKDIPARRRNSEIEKFRKLLSRLRKSVAKIENS